MDLLLKIFVLFGIFIQYAATILSLSYRKYNVFAVVYLLSIFFYDFLFINASYFLPSSLVAVLKPYNEYLFIFLTIRLFLVKLNNIKSRNILMDKIILYLILVTLAVLLLNDFSSNIDPVSTILGIRIYLLPILLPYLMYKANWLATIDKKTFLSSLFLATLITIGYGTIQQMTFNGNVNSLWFYKFFNLNGENPVETGFYNFVRNDKLRTTSFFVSPIIYSISVAMSAVFVATLLIMKQNKMFKRSTLFLLLIAFIYGLLIAETRVGIFILAMAIAMLLVTKLTNRKGIYKLLATIPFIAMILTFLSLIYGYTDDLSALGRLIQYMSFFEYFKPLGLGFNSEYVLTMFDTYYMSLALVYGVFIVVPIYFYYKLNKVLYYQILEINGLNLLFAKGVFVLSLTFIYSFAFQFTAGAYQFRMLFFLIFIVLSNGVNNVSKTSRLSE